MTPTKEPFPIICERCNTTFMGKYAFICPGCRIKASRESAIRRNLNKLGNNAYSKQQAKKRKGG